MNFRTKHLEQLAQDTGAELIDKQTQGGKHYWTLRIDDVTMLKGVPKTVCVTFLQGVYVGIYKRKFVFEG